MNEKNHYLKGVELLKKGSYYEALSSFNKALEINPDYCDGLTDRAITFFYLKKTDLCMIDLNRAVELEPTNPFRYSSRAYIKEKLGDNLGAIDDYKKAVELDPEDAIAYNNLGLVEEKLGYIQRAKINYQKADYYFESGSYKKNIFTNNKFQIPLNTGKLNKIIKDIFTKKSVFKEFIQFICNGFKLKK